MANQRKEVTREFDGRTSHERPKHGNQLHACLNRINSRGMHISGYVYPSKTTLMLITYPQS